MTQVDMRRDPNEREQPMAEYGGGRRTPRSPRMSHSSYGRSPLTAHRSPLTAHRSGVGVWVVLPEAVADGEEGGSP